jgi:hypothetical protein
MKQMITTFFIGLFFALFLVSLTYQRDESFTSANNLRIMSNAFFFPGAFMFFSGLTVVVDNNEGFDFIRYGFMKFMQVVKRQKDFDGPKNFYEYRNEASLRSKSSSYVPLLLNGILFILVNVVFWVMLNNMYPNLPL